MNERIKNLLDKATIKDHWSVDENRYLTHFVDQEKFAELIVRECVRHFNEDYQRDFDTLWREDLSKSIKQHFGVKK